MTAVRSHGLKAWALGVFFAWFLLPTAGAEELRARAVPPLVFHHAASATHLVDTLTARAPGDLARIQAALGVSVPPTLHVHVVPRGGSASPSDWGLPEGPDWAAGYALPGRPVVVLRTADLSAASGNEAATVLAHEMAHAVVDAALAGRAGALPAWMSEGMAAHLALEWRLAQDASSLAQVLPHGWMPLRDISGRFPASAGRRQLAYLESFAFLNWLVRRAGPAALPDFVREFAAGAPFEVAFLRAFGAPSPVLEQQFKRTFVRRYRWIPLLTSSTLPWLFLALLVVVGRLRQRRRDALVVAGWEEEALAAAQAEEAAALAAIPGATTDGEAPTAAPEEGEGP